MPKRRIKPARAGLLGCGHSDWSRSRSSTALRASFSRRCFSAARSTMVPHCAHVTGSLGPGFAVAALNRVPPHCGHLRVNLICVICQIACQVALRPTPLTRTLHSTPFQRTRASFSRIPYLASRIPHPALTPPCSQTRPHPERSAATPPPPRAPPPPPAETRAGRCASPAPPPPARYPD